MDRLGGARGGSTDCRFGGLDAPKMGENGDAASVHGHHGGVFVCVGHTDGQISVLVLGDSDVDAQEQLIVTRVRAITISRTDKHDVLFCQILHHQALRLLLHVRAHKARKIEIWPAIKIEFVF